MALKIGNWLVGLGCFFGFAGLCFLPAAFGLHPDNTLLSAGAMLFCLGMVLASSGMYVKARHLAVLTPPSSDIKRGRKLCDVCSKQKAVIQCRVHQLQICGDCLEDHYDFRSCAYAPTVRQVGAKTRTYAQSSGA
ncbi:MAG: hypothetical protein ABSG70_06660 [Terriglobales bacterium]|jgi:hypothetical protein